MLRLSNISLRWRLFTGFLIVSAMTFLAGSSGVIAMRQLRGNVSETTLEINSSLEQQIQQTNHIINMRELISNIDSAQNMSDILQVRKSVSDLEDVSFSTSKDQTIDMRQAIDAFLQIKTEEIETSVNLTKLREKTVTELKQTASIVSNVVDDIGLKAGHTIENALTQTKNKTVENSKILGEEFEKISSTATNAISHIKAVLTIRSLSSELNALLKESLLASDVAIVAYAQKQVDTILGNIDKEFKAFGDGESVKEINDLVVKISNLAPKLLDAKKDKLRSDAESTSNNDALAKVTAELNSVLAEINNKVVAVIDDIDFETAIAIEEVLENANIKASENVKSIAKAFKEVSTATSNAIGQSKAALNVQANTYALNAAIFDTLLSSDVSFIESSHKTVNSLCSKIGAELGVLPQNDEVAKIIKSMDETAILGNKLLDAKMQMLWLNESLELKSTSLTSNIATVNMGIISAAEDLQNSVSEKLSSISAAVDKGNMAVVVITLFAIAVALSIGIVLPGSIAKVLNRIVESLKQSSNQVTSAACQVSNASQSLAEGASEQAAGFEETSSSLEEVASMTKQNADSAQQANTLATDARKAADAGNESMARMHEAIQDIQKGSDETAKIIKVIDEIAFQTNLLALNAAVEAARAGEAGKGFAVVAEEVRNLALRSAEAARDTSGMIEESVKNANNGVKIAAEVGKVLEDIVDGIGKTTDLVGEIAAASKEQSQGINQVNTAVNQMDRVTQANASNAEGSASASEELSTQAEQMNTVVQELSALIGGNSQANTESTACTPKTTMKTSDNTFHQIADGRGIKDARHAL